MLSQPADFDAEEELLRAESVAMLDEPLDADEEDITAAETRSLLGSPEGSIAHSDLGQLLVFLLRPRYGCKVF